MVLAPAAAAAGRRQPQDHCGGTAETRSAAGRRQTAARRASQLSIDEFAALEFDPSSLAPAAVEMLRYRVDDDWGNSKSALIVFSAIAGKVDAPTLADGGDGASQTLAEKTGWRPWRRRGSSPLASARPISPLPHWMPSRLLAVAAAEGQEDPATRRTAARRADRQAKARRWRSPTSRASPTRRTPTPANATRQSTSMSWRRAARRCGRSASK